MSVFLYEPFYDFDRLFEEAFSARMPHNQRQQLQGSEAANAAPRFLKPRYADQTVFLPHFSLTRNNRMDLHEDAERNTVTATFELPGLEKDNIQLDVNNGTLSVSAEMKASEEHEREGYAVRERRFGKFRRTLQLPQGIKVRVVTDMQNQIGLNADDSPFFRRKKLKRP
jgi:HSP20 family protein